MRWIVPFLPLLVAPGAASVPAAGEARALEELGRLLVLQEAVHRKQQSYSGDRRVLGLPAGEKAGPGLRIESADEDHWRAVAKTGGVRWNLRVQRGPSMAIVRNRIRRELRDLITPQARYRAKNGVYADRLAPLGIDVASDIRMTANGDRGWTAEASRPLFVDRSCVLRVGSIQPRPATRRDERRGFPGQVVCDRPAEGIYDRKRRERAYREVGRALQRYLDRQQSALADSSGFLPDMTVREPQGTIVTTVARPRPTRIEAVAAHEVIGRVSWKLVVETAGVSPDGD